MKATDSITVTTILSVDPGTAFRFFTDDVDLWWRRGPRYRPEVRGEGTMRFEPGVGGRLVEVYDEAMGDAFEIGRILVWEPGARLVFDWRARNFEPGEKTVVEVRFERADGGTRVTLEHRGWDSIPAGHPVRHGWTGEAFSSLIGLRWADLLVSLRNRAGDKAA
ncbi:MAG TPA: SRPBCC domain-containing protein [Vicinamibacteria bacterium]|nr:SRPBCC domain-containing protein [Vicinamibacteria bacterium]